MMTLKEVRYIKDLKEVYDQYTELNPLGVKYRLFHFENHRRVTVALFEEEGKYALGYSICDPEDTFSRKIGQDVAKARAEEKMKLKTPVERMLPTKEDLSKVPTHLRKSLVEICYDFYNKYELLGEDND